MFHPTSSAASITDIVSRQSEFVVITGKHGTGKTALARYIALTLHRDESRSIVPIKCPDDMFEFLSQIKRSRQKYVLVIDDLLGRQTVCKADARQWIQLYKEKIETNPMVRPFRIIASCRLQISTSPEFASLRNLYRFTVCNISGDFKNDTLEMREIALCHVDMQKVEILFRKNFQENNNFYTLCYLNSRLFETNNSDIDLFNNAFHTIEEQINDMYKHNEPCFLHLALIIIFDGRLSKHRFQLNNESICKILDDVRKECKLNNVQNSQVLQGTHPIVGRYLKDSASYFTIIHPELVDILSVYFFKKMPQSMIEYGSDKFLQMKIQIESIGSPLSPGIILIEKWLEDMFFTRIVRDIKNEKFDNAFDNIQVSNILYQDKLISYLSRFSEVQQLVLSNFDTLLLSVQNDAINLVNFIIVECRNCHILIHYSKNEFLLLYEERVILKFYYHCQEESLLLLACLKGYSAVAKVLLSLGFDKNYQDEFERTPLQMACLHGSIDVVRLLLQHSCDVNLCNSNGETALHHACFWGYTDVVDTFLRNLRTDTAKCLKPDYTMRNSYLNTPVFLACEQGHLGIVKLFSTLENLDSCPVPNPFDITEIDFYERNMLHVACRNGHKEIVAILLEKNFDVNVSDTKGRTPIFYACKKGYTNLVGLLMKKDLNVNIQDNSGQTPLHIACDSSHGDVVLLLLQSQCELNTEDRNGKTPLHLAVQNNSATIIGMLLQSHPEFETSDSQKPIAKSDINAQDKEGHTALHIACIEGCANSVKILLQYQSNLDKCDEENKTALFCACEKQEEYIVELLVDCGVDVNISDNSGKSPLHIAVEKENIKLMKTILKCQNCQVNSMYEDDFYGFLSALHVAITKSNAPFVKILLNSNCDVNQRGPKLQTPFMYACESFGDVSEIRRLLLNNNCDVNIPDVDGKIPLHIASKGSDLQLIKMILKRCQDINTTDNLGRNALHYASECNNINTINLLIKENCNINQCDSNNETPIFWAIRSVFKKNNIQPLIRSHCDINIANNDGMTLLHIACSDDDLFLIRTLIRNGCNVSIADKLGRTAFHIASEYSCEESIALLVKNCDVNVKNNKGQTSLHIACQRQSLEIVNLILHHGCDVNIQDNSGNTALHIAAKRRHISIMETLLRAKCDVNIRDDTGQTPIFYAVENREINIVKLLVKNNCDVTLQNDGGSTALQIAITKGYSDIADVLSL